MIILVVLLPILAVGVFVGKVIIEKPKMVCIEGSVTQQEIVCVGSEKQDESSHSLRVE